MYIICIYITYIYTNIHIHTDHSHEDGRWQAGARAGANDSRRLPHGARLRRVHEHALR